MLEYWVVAVGLLLVLEGVMPLAFPALWKMTVRRMAQLQDGQLRFVGLSMVAAGALVVFWVKQ